MDRQLALANFLGTDREVIEPISDIEFATLEGNFLVLTDEEANEKAKDAILDSASYFSPDFLSEITDLDPCIFEALTALGERANLAILKLLEATCGLDKFVDAALGENHRRFYLSVDNCEGQIGEYYIYEV